MDSCERNTDRFIDALTGNLADADRLALDEHIATCDRCRQESTAMRELWDTLASAPIPARPVDASTPTGPWVTAPPRRRTRVPLAIAASLILGLLGGYLAGSSQGDHGGAASGQHDYLLLLRQASTTLGPAAPPESVLVREYGAWADDLAARNALLMAERLNDDDITLLAGGGLDPAARETARHISGFFLVRATTFDEATAIAATIPHLRYGGSVEVRAVARD